MKIAVTFEDGVIGQHFGHAKAFKVYTVEDEAVVATEIVEPGCSGHGPLSEYLAENGINALICGGIGEMAKSILTVVGIDVCSGVEGDPDEAVAAFIKDELANTGDTCEHHGEEGGCGCHDDEDCDCEGECGSCGGGCGGGCGGCHSAPAFEGPNVGKSVRVNYRGTLDDGTQFDSSYDRGQTLDFVCGAGMMIPGFDKAVATMEVGQTIKVHLMPEEAYGYPSPNAIFPVEIAQLPGSEELQVGQRVVLYASDGRPIPVAVAEKTETVITFDANHELAGKELNFEIELVEVQ